MDARLEKALADLREASRALGIAAENCKAAADGILAAFDGRVFIPIAREAEPEVQPQPEHAVEVQPAPQEGAKQRIYLHKRHPVWTEKEMAFLALCRKAGLSYADMKERLEAQFGFSVSTQSIRHRIAIMEGRE
jgi:hypothetical protein